MTKAEIEKLQKEFDVKAERYFNEYQETGINGKYKTYEKYDNLSKICELAIKQISDNTYERSKRFDNYSEYLKGLVDKQYSLTELKEIVWKTEFF